MKILGKNPNLTVAYKYVKKHILILNLKGGYHESITVGRQGIS